MDKDDARRYLMSLLNQNLRITTTDGRIFRGSFKCTDAEENIVLAQTFEYRQPSSARKQQAKEAEAETEATEVAAEREGPVTLDMSSRHLGLVVVPGQHITKIEVEQFASQRRVGSDTISS